MTLAPGTRLLHYEITRKLGEGGMGEVYAARDGKLGRDVALKLLPPELAGDPERVARFEREARTLASLQHPCVASLYGFEEDGERRFLVMELVEGEDLSALLARGPVPIEEAREIALRIAEGLEAAHRKGIVHRDLKPANVKISRGGEVKILDFGLARAVLDSPDEIDDPNRSPTVTEAFTRPGVILGTAAYMSPEQARGRAVDERCDVWAFGVLLFEMLTGERLFAGETISDTLAAVLRKEPDGDALPADTSPAVRRLLRRCLAKDPRQRLQSIGDARIELEEKDPAEQAPPGAAPAGRPDRTWRPHPAWILPLAIGIVVGSWLAHRFEPERGVPARLTTYGSIQLPEGWQLGGWGAPLVTLSPDGRTLAFVAQRGPDKRLFVHRLEEPSAVEVPDSDGAEGPFFSPDGRHVAFGSGAISGQGSGPGRLRRYSIERGTTGVVCEVSDYFGGAWREDDTLFFVNVIPGPLWRVPASGGSPEPVGGQRQLEVSRERPAFLWPQILPGGTHALGIVLKGEIGGRVSTIDLSTGEIRDLGADALFARRLGANELILGLPDGRVFAARIDPESYEIDPDRRQILEGVSLSGHFNTVVDVSETGDLVYARGLLGHSRRDLSRITWLREDGRLEPVEAFEAGEFTGLAISPDGRRIAVTSGFDDVAVLDLERGTRLPLPTRGALGARDPHWTPSGREIVLTASSVENPLGNNLFLLSADGIDPPRQLESRSGEFFAWSFVPGTRRVLHAGYLSGAEFDNALFEIDLDGGEPKRILDADGHSVHTPAISPDGRWLAYASNESGRREIYLRSFPDLARKIPMGEGRGPRWGPAGEKLYFQRGSSPVEGSIWVRDVSLAGDEPVVAEPRVVARAQGFRLWRVDPLERGILGLKLVEGAGVVDHLELVQGWAGGRRD